MILEYHKILTHFKKAENKIGIYCTFSDSHAKPWPEWPEFKYLIFGTNARCLGI